MLTGRNNKIFPLIFCSNPIFLQVSEKDSRVLNPCLASLAYIFRSLFLYPFIMLLFVGFWLDYFDRKHCKNSQRLCHDKAPNELLLVTIKIMV